MWFCLPLVVFFLVSCSGQFPSTEVSTRLPQVPQSTHEAAAVSLLLGSDFNHELPKSNFKVTGQSVVLDGVNNLAYVMYSFALGSDDYMLSLQVDAVGPFWIGVPNYDTDRWQLTGPYSDTALISLTNGGSLSQDTTGNFNVAVVTVGEAIINSLLLDVATLQPDTLYLIPESTEVRIGEPLRLTVVTGRVSDPFHHPICTFVTEIESGLEYVPGSRNAGAVGGGVDEVDGFWKYLQPSSLSVVPDEMMKAWNPSETLRAIPFNVMPWIESDVRDVSGPILNLQVSFANHGTWHLRFLDFHPKYPGYPMTYYEPSGADSFDDIKYWDNIDNDDQSISSVITVLP